jgi:PAS domain S-box-containing protein
VLDPTEFNLKTLGNWLRHFQQRVGLEELLLQITQDLGQSPNLSACLIGQLTEVKTDGILLLKPIQKEQKEIACRIYQPEILSLLQADPHHNLVLDTKYSGWIEKSEDPDWTQVQILGACYPQSHPPWLLGIALSSQPIIWTEELSAGLGHILQIIEFFIEQSSALSHFHRVEERYRFVTHRLMDRFRVATEASRQVVYEWDLTTDQIEWSKAMRIIFGHSLTLESETRSWWQKQIYPEDQRRILSQWQSCLENLQVFFGEYRWQRADGYYAWVQDYGRIFCGPQGNPVRVVGSMEDITTRHATSLVLHRMTEGFRLALELSPTPIVVITADYRVTETNEAFLALLGYSRLALQDMGGLAMIIHPVDLEADAWENLKVANHEISCYRTCKRFFHAEGYEITAEVTITPLGGGLGDSPFDKQFFWQIDKVLPQ